MSKEILQNAREVLVEAGLLGANLLVALSGGVDSVCLFQVLRRLWQDHRGRLEVAHVDHGLRAGSARDAEFCRRLCSRYGIAFHLLSLPAGSLDGPGSLQARARRVRREYFLRTLEERALQAVALGHHADDQVETVLYRLLRGTGLRGVAGMQRVSLPFVRPFLGVRRAELVALAEAEGWCFRPDPSNEDLRFARNRLRKEIAPRLSGVHPGAEHALLRFARLAREEDGVLTRLAREWLDGHGVAEPEGVRMPVAGLRDLEAPIRRRVYLAAWQGIGGNPAHLELHHLEAVDQLLEPGRAHRFSPVSCSNRFAVSYDQLWVLRQRASPSPDVRLHVKLGESCLLPHGAGRVTWKQMPAGAHQGLEVAPRASEDRLALRPWQPGDRVRTATREKKVKDLLMEHKVPLWRRRQAWLVSRGSEALGVVGTGFALGGDEGGGSWLWWEEDASRVRAGEG